MLIIGIAGGSGSGKTTVVKAITESLNKKVAVISQDSYYKDSSHIPVEDRKQINFDHPDAIDWELLCRQLKDLKSGKTIQQPVYSYISCSRSKTETVTVEPADVIIIEGILIFTCKELLDDIGRSLSFYILGDDTGQVQAILSPIWQDYDKNADKKLLPNSLRVKVQAEDGTSDFSRILGRKCDVSNINIYNNPTGGNPDGFSLREEGGEKPKDALEIKRDRGEACRVVREYFRWVRQQTDADHQSLVNDLLLRLMEPRDCKGELIESQCLSRDDAQHVLSVLFTQVLPDRLSRQDKFFEAKYMAHPEKRIYWMRNLMKSYAYKHIACARELWLRRKDVVLELEQQRQ